MAATVREAVRESGGFSIDASIRRTWSVMWAATSAMRRVLQEGQMARPRPRDHALSHLNPLAYPLTQVLAPETRPGVSYSLLSGVP